MFLRRISTHLKQQDWTAIAIDFAIVIVGVFIAFQVTEWNEQRKQRGRTEAYLERLHDEALEVVEFMEARSQRRGAWLVTQTQVVVALHQGTWGELSDASLQLGLGTLMFLPALTPPSSTWEELAASGGLADIESASVRSALSNYQASLRFHDGQLTLFRAEAFDLGDYAGRGVAPRLNVDTGMPDAFDFDLEMLTAQPDFMYEVARALRTQGVFQRMEADILDAAHAMCAGLAEVTGRGCPARAGA